MDLRIIRTDPKLLEALCRRRTMTPEQWREQRVSGIYGLCGWGVTKDQVRRSVSASAPPK